MKRKRGEAPIEQGFGDEFMRRGFNSLSGHFFYCRVATKSSPRGDSGIPTMNKSRYEAQEGRSPY